jgi:uncharacterized protein
MRLKLQEVIRTPGLSLPFDFELDLSGMEFYGLHPIVHPIRVRGQVRNAAGALMLEGEASTVLSLLCDRCGKPFEREKTVPFSTLLATELEDEDSDDILLLNGAELDMDEVASTAFILAMDTKNLCFEDCRGICPGCGVDLNEENCRCRPETDPRLAALKQLLDK